MAIVGYTKHTHGSPDSTIIFHFPVIRNDVRLRRRSFGDLL